MFRTAVSRASHFDNLKEPQKVPHAFGIAHDDDAVCDGLFNTKGGPVSVFGGRCDFGDEDGGAAKCCQFLAQGEKEIPYQLL